MGLAAEGLAWRPAVRRRYSHFEQFRLGRLTDRCRPRCSGSAAAYVRPLLESAQTIAGRPKTPSAWPARRCLRRFSRSSRKAGALRSRWQDVSSLLMEVDDAKIGSTCPVIQTTGFRGLKRRRSSPSPSSSNSRIIFGLATPRALSANRANHGMAGATRRWRSAPDFRSSQRGRAQVTRSVLVRPRFGAQWRLTLRPGSSKTGVRVSYRHATDCHACCACVWRPCAESRSPQRGRR
jgi:hypothetical protein